MPQKPLKASGGKVSKPGKKHQQAANRHGKAPQMRKGEHLLGLGAAAPSARARARAPRRQRPRSLTLTPLPPFHPHHHNHNP
jgi:hypothetical protein